VLMGQGGGPSQVYTCNPVFGTSAFSALAQGAGAAVGGELKFYMGNGYTGWCFSGPSVTATLRYQTCAVSCATCSGTLPSNCLSCSGSLFLWNNTCLTSCPTGYANSATHACVSSCPSGAFANPLAHTCQPSVTISAASGVVSASGCDTNYPGVLYFSLAIPSNFSTLQYVDIVSTASFTPSAANSGDYLLVANSAGTIVYAVLMGQGGGPSQVYTYNPVFGTSAFSALANATAAAVGGELKFYMGNGYTGWCFSGPSVTVKLQYLPN